MRIRKLLLVHPSRSIRALIKKYIFSELSDIEIGEAYNGQHALEQLAAKGYDVIISSEQLKDMKLEIFKNHQEATAPNSCTPLIIISESESDHVRDGLVQQGFDRVVQIRVNPSDLIQKINAVCDPRKWRKDARFHIPNASAVLTTPLKELQASVINLSKGGVFVELVTDEPSELMNGGLSLALQIPNLENSLVIDALTIKLLRIETVSWTQGHIPKKMRATFIFVDLESGPKSKLAELIRMVKEEKLAATEVVN
jgi:DNA-binding response OmpR family regulator